MVRSTYNSDMALDKIQALKKYEQSVYSPIIPNKNPNIMTLKKYLLENETVEAGQQKRLIPQLNIEPYQHLHLHLASRSQKIGDLAIKVLYGTSVKSKILLCDTAVWFDDQMREQEFNYTTSTSFSGTGLILNLPVIAPLLYDVILTNLGGEDIRDLFVTLLAVGR